MHPHAKDVLAPGRQIAPGERSSRRPIRPAVGPPGTRPVQLIPAQRIDAALQARPIFNTPKPSAVLSSARLERQQPYFERAVGAALLGLSIAGSVAAFQGGWGMPAAGPLALGVAAQALITYMEWAYRRRRISVAYLFALGSDIALSVAGYSVIVLSGMRRLFTVVGFGATMSAVAAWFCILLAAALLAYVPERILVKE